MNTLKIGDDNKAGDKDLSNKGLRTTGFELSCEWETFTTQLCLDMFIKDSDFLPPHTVPTSLLSAQVSPATLLLPLISPSPEKDGKRRRYDALCTHDGIQLHPMVVEVF